VTARYIIAQKMAACTRLALMWACLTAVVTGVLIAGAVPPVGVLLLLIVAIRSQRRRLPVSGAFGVARFADVIDLMLARMLFTRSGVLVGRVGGVARPPSLGQRLGALFFWPESRSIEACYLNSADARRIRRAFVRISDFTHGIVVGPPAGGA
jgi:hypothetical protein